MFDGILIVPLKEPFRRVHLTLFSCPHCYFEHTQRNIRINLFNLCPKMVKHTLKILQQIL